jgi:hypothetical protein
MSANWPFFNIHYLQLESYSNKKIQQKKSDSRLQVSSNLISKKIHNDLYNYNYVLYVNDTTPVKIECVKHGIFNQVPNVHLSGHGCIFCSGRYKYTNEEFIEKSILTHGKKYEDIAKAIYEYRMNVLTKEFGMVELRLMV